MHYTYDTYALSNVAGKAMVKRGENTWFFITADYAFGHAFERDAANVVKKAGGTVVGSSDRTGGYPSTDPQTPENLAATIYHALGLPRTVAWTDALDRPHHVYHADPIRGLG